jgi:hypothetical protein
MICAMDVAGQRSFVRWMSGTSSKTIVPAGSSVAAGHSLALVILSIQ